MDETLLKQKLEDIFAYLHEHPEISWNEINTTQYIKRLLEEIGLQPITFNDITGLYVDIGEGSPKVGFRTDMDALWQEVDGEFRANHSCGHDGHMTMAMGVALLLNEQKDKLPGAVRIIFQPAEEKGEGAKKIIEKGVVDDLEYLFGVHVRPLFEIPDGVHAPAIYHGGSKLVTGTITGEDAHGARPEQGVNAIEVAAALVTALQRVWINPNEAGSIKMTQLHAGGVSNNIIPGKAHFGIDIRAESNETMEEITKGLARAVEAVSMLYGAKIELEEELHLAAAKVNDEAKAIMEQAIILTVGKEHCVKEVVTPGGEDFHFYSFARPHLKTTMLGLGCGVTPGLHHPNMTFNRDQLIVGAQIITQALLTALHR